MPRPVLKRRTPPVHFAKRQRVHRHNSYLGHACMMQAQINNMMAADSVSIEAKRILRLIDDLVGPLKIALKERIDP